MHTRFSIPALAIAAGAITLLESALAGTAPWANIGGFFAGMTKQEAKAAGYVNCANGSDSGESSDSIYCEIPPTRRGLGSLPVTYAKLEFKGPKHDRVDKIHLKVEGKQQEVLTVLKQTYGEILDGGRTYAWQRDTAHTISMPKRQLLNTTWITFDYDPALPAAVKKQRESDKKKSNALKTF